MSEMTMSSMSPVRNPQRPPSTPLLDPPLLDTLLIKISTLIFQDIFLGVKNIIHDVRNDHVLHVSAQKPSMSSKYPPSWHISKWDMNTTFSGYLPWSKNHYLWHQEGPGHPCCRSGTLNDSHVPPSWHTSNCDIDTNISGYLPWGKRT